MMVPAVELGERSFTTWCLVGRVELPNGQCMKPISLPTLRAGTICPGGSGGRHRGNDYPSCGRFRERFQKHSKRPSFRTFHHSCNRTSPSQCGGKAEGRDVASSCFRPAPPTDCIPLPHDFQPIGLVGHWLLTLGINLQKDDWKYQVGLDRTAFKHLACAGSSRPKAPAGCRGHGILILPHPPLSLEGTCG